MQSDAIQSTLGFLSQEPEVVLNRLYGSQGNFVGVTKGGIVEEVDQLRRQAPWACKAIFQCLSALSKNYILRLLFVTQKIDAESLKGWLCDASAEILHEKVIDELKSLKILLEDDDERMYNEDGDEMDVVFQQIHGKKKKKKRAKVANVWLNPHFQESLQKALCYPTEPWMDFSKGFEVKHEEEKRIYPTIDEIEEFSSSRWSDVLKILLNVKASATCPPPNTDTAKVIRSFCQAAQLMRDGKITSGGYEYLLKDRQSQVWIFVKTGISRLKSSEQALSLLFMLSYCELGKGYAMDALTPVQKQLILDLSHVGIIYLRNAGSSRFFPTKMSINLIFQKEAAILKDGIFDDGSTAGSAGATDATLDSAGRLSVTNTSSTSGKSSLTSILATVDARKGTSRELEIIVQTNCQVVAYSSSELHIAMLQLFVDVNLRFPNMVTGRITRDRIKDAYRMGMRADQIISFLTAHAHPRVADRSPIVPDNVSDQLLLWQAENARLRFQECVVLELDKIGVSKEVFDDLVEYAQKRLHACLWVNAQKLTIALTPEGYHAFKDYIYDEYNI